MLAENSLNHSPSKPLPCEVIKQILKHLMHSGTFKSSKRPLFSCLQINRQWANVSIEILWEEVEIAYESRLVQLASALSIYRAYANSHQDWHVQPAIKKLKFTPNLNYGFDALVQILEPQKYVSSNCSFESIHTLSLTFGANFNQSSEGFFPWKFISKCTDLKSLTFDEKFQSRNSSLLKWSSVMEDNDTLGLVFNVFTRLHHLSLDLLQEDSSFFASMPICFRLRRLRLDDPCIELVDDLKEKLPNLRVFVVRFIRNPNPAANDALKACIQGFSQVASLSISTPSMLVQAIDALVMNVCISYARLSFLDWDCAVEGNQVLSLLMHRGVNLVKLKINLIDNVSDEILAQMTRYSPRLESACFYRASWEQVSADALVKWFSACKKVQYVEVSEYYEALVQVAKQFSVKVIKRS